MNYYLKGMLVSEASKILLEYINGSHHDIYIHTSEGYKHLK